MFRWKKGVCIGMAGLPFQKALNIICVTLIDFLPIIKRIPQFLIKGKLFLQRERRRERYIFSLVLHPLWHLPQHRRKLDWVEYFCVCLHILKFMCFGYVNIIYTFTLKLPSVVFIDDITGNKPQIFINFGKLQSVLVQHNLDWFPDKVSQFKSL